MIARVKARALALWATLSKTGGRLGLVVLGALAVDLLLSLAFPYSKSAAWLGGALYMGVWAFFVTRSHYRKQIDRLNQLVEFQKFEIDTLNYRLKRRDRFEKALSK